MLLLYTQSCLLIPTGDMFIGPLFKFAKVFITIQWEVVKYLENLESRIILDLFHENTQTALIACYILAIQTYQQNNVDFQQWFLSFYLNVDLIYGWFTAAVSFFNRLQ